MPTVFASCETAATEKKDSSSTKRKAKSSAIKMVADNGEVLHSHPLFALGWQVIPLLLTSVVLLSGFVAYQRVDWQNTVSRVNEAANPTRPAQAAEAVPSPTLEFAVAKPKPGKGEERGKPVATQATASAGLLIVKSPAIARIYVDGKFAGNTPHSFTVAAGEHVLMLVAEGYQQWTRKVVVKGNQQVGIMAALQKVQ
jgi:hypothetical protein